MPEKDDVAELLGATTVRAFGEGVRKLRQMKGLSQQALAGAASAAGAPMHQTTITKIESGTRATSLSEAATLAAVLDAPLADLLSGGVPMGSGVSRWDSDVRRCVAEWGRVSKELGTTVELLYELRAEFARLLGLAPDDAPSGTLLVAQTMANLDIPSHLQEWADRATRGGGSGAP